MAVVGEVSARMGDPAPKEEEAAAAYVFARQRTEAEQEMSTFATLTTYFGYAVLILVGHLRDLFARLTGLSRWQTLVESKSTRVAPLFKNWENFYARRLYHRIGDVFNRPINSSPSARIRVMERALKQTAAGSEVFEVTGATRECVNLGSYNYLGFADDWLETCGGPVLETVRTWPISTGSSRGELGTTRLHRDVEAAVAAFVGKEDAVVFNMGFGTNLTTVPALVSKGDLVISDALNHASIVNGCRASGAMIRAFEHNDAADLARVLREAIALGHPRTRRPWRKILVMVEGIYSMEGVICNLKAIAATCKRYKAYLYLDEAHSIGALGATGRGACEHCGVDPADVDILMGTFTKSFGGMGGYIAASRDVITHLKARCPGLLNHDAMSPVMCAQIKTATDIIAGRDGTKLGAEKLDDLKANSNFFRSELIKAGLHVYGSYDSPIIPVLLYNPTKIAAFSRECFNRGLAVVVVGFPATTLVKSRARFCVSAGHSRADLVDALKTITQVAKLIKIQYAASAFG